MKLGEGLVGWAALHKEPVLVADVSQGPALRQPGRRRAVGAGHPDADQGPLHRRVRPREPRAGRVHEGAQGAADAAGQPGGGRDRERAPLRRGPAERGAHREGAAVRAARAGGAAPDRAAEGADAASTSRAASSRPRELGGDLHDFLSPEPDTLVVAVGDVSGKGAPAALYGAFAAELVRSRTLRRRFTPERFSVAGVLQAMNTILHERQLEEYYCTLCYALLRFQGARRDAVELRPAVSDPLHRGRMRSDRAAGRAAGIVCRRDLRRGDAPAAPGRRLRVLQRRDFRDHECGRGGVWRASRLRNRPRPPPRRPRAPSSTRSSTPRSSSAVSVRRRTT